MSARTIPIAVAAPAAAPLPFASGTEHLLAELDWLRLVLQREILRLKAANLLSSDPFRGLYLSDEQVEATLREWTIQPSDDQREYTMPGLAELSESIDAVQLQINR